MKILVACEFSGIIRDAFAAKGWEAWSCDVVASERPGNHLRMDVREALACQWDMMIAHPPCRVMALSGVWMLSRDKHRHTELKVATEFFRMLHSASIPRVVVENPTPHRYASLPKYSQIIHPWQYGHTEGKATCLWLKGVPHLRPTNDVREEMMKLPYKERQKVRQVWGGSINGWKDRARTFAGIAAAMAEQWTEHINRKGTPWLL